MCHFAQARLSIERLTKSGRPLFPLTFPNSLKPLEVVLRLASVFNLVVKFFNLLLVAMLDYSTLSPFLKSLSHGNDLHLGP